MVLEVLAATYIIGFVATLFSVAWPVLAMKPAAKK